MTRRIGVPYLIPAIVEVDLDEETVAAVAAYADRAVFDPRTPMLAAGSIPIDPEAADAFNAFRIAESNSWPGWPDRDRQE